MVEEHPTEVMAVEETGTIDAEPADRGGSPPSGGITAPSGMDSSATKFIETNPDPATEIISTPTEPMSSDKPVAPQMIPPRRDAAPQPPQTAGAAGAGWWR